MAIHMQGSKRWAFEEVTQLYVHVLPIPSMNNRKASPQPEDLPCYICTEFQKLFQLVMLNVFRGKIKKGIYSLNKDFPLEPVSIYKLSMITYIHKM